MSESRLVIRMPPPAAPQVKAPSPFKMSSDRTKMVTIKLEPPSGSQGGHSQSSDHDDDLAAVLRWLGEASAAGWRVTAHIPSTQLALVVSIVDADEPEEEEEDDGDAETIVDSEGEDASLGSESQQEDSEEQPALPPPTKAVTYAPDRASSVRKPQPKLPLPRLRSPSRRR